MQYLKPKPPPVQIPVRRFIITRNSTGFCVHDERGYIVATTPTRWLAATKAFADGATEVRHEYDPRIPE